MSGLPQAPPSLGRHHVHPPSVQLLGQGFCRKKHVVVLGEVHPNPHEPVEVGMLEPEDRDLVGRLQRFLQHPIVPVPMSAEQIEHALDLGYERWREGTARATLEPAAGAAPVDADARDAQAVLEALLGPAVAAGASHVHIERRGPRVVTRIRVDGRLLPLPGPVSVDNVEGVLKRVRDLAGASGTEGRLLTRFGPPTERRPIELRFTIVAGTDGDEAVLRLVDPEAPPIPLPALGLEPDALAVVESLVRGPPGLLLVAGPGGSGTTTTLHAMLRTIDVEAHKVVAVEEPVELQLDGVSHRRIDEASTRAHHLRALPDQDADVVLVDELPDPSTAEAAVRAAERGLRVLTRVFAPDAVGAVMRLAATVDPRELAPVLRGVIAQRLVPRLGQRGLTAIFEVLRVTPELAQVIAAGAGAPELHRAVRAQGLRSLLESARLRAERGEIDLGPLQFELPG